MEYVECRTTWQEEGLIRLRVSEQDLVTATTKRTIVHLWEQFSVRFLATAFLSILQMEWMDVDEKSILLVL